MFPVVMMLVLSASDVRVELQRCPRVEARLVERQLKLELSRSTVAATRVRIRCDATQAVLEAATTFGPVETTVSIDEMPTVALARTLALAAAELLLRAPPPPPPVTSPMTGPEVRAPQATPRERLWLRAGGGVEGVSALLGGVQASVAVQVWLLWVVADLRYGRAGFGFPQGRATVDVLDLSLGAQLEPVVGTFRFPLGLGVRVGHAWVSASPADGVDAAAVRGVRVAPVAMVGAHWRWSPGLTVGVDVQLGWTVRGVRGLVDGAAGVSLERGLVVTTASVGVRW
jgi:hypothetical protein